MTRNDIDFEQEDKIHNTSVTERAEATNQMSEAALKTLKRTKSGGNIF